MSLDVVRKDLEVLRSTLEMIDADIAAEELPPDAVQAFTSAVESVRGSVWVVLTDRQDGQYEQFLARMQVRRATEICDDVLSDLVAETLPKNTVGLAVFQATLSELVDAFGGRVR